MMRLKPLHFDITLHKAPEIEAMERRILELQRQLEAKQSEVYRMAEYADLSLRLTDQLQEARRRLSAAGLDSSFIKI